MRYIAFLLFLLFTTTNAMAVTERQDNLEICGDESIGILYLCDSKWTTDHLENAVLMIINTDPLATVTIAQIDTEIKFLSQLSDNFLEKRGLYKDGFKTNRVMIGQRDAIAVKAFSKKSDRRVLDYFFIHDDSLYGLLFSVYPKERWDEYKFLIKQITDSIAFTK